MDWEDIPSTQPLPPPEAMPPPPSYWLGLAFVVALAGCRVSPGSLQDPTLLIEGSAGSELGVNTDYGILFLGRRTSAGRIAVTAWFGDGPNIETTIVEPVGGGVYTAEAEIRLPSIPLTFVEPEAGRKVLVVGRRMGRPWKTEATVATDPRVESGILLDLEAPSGLVEDLLGAPVLIEIKRGTWRCLGIVSGRLELSGPGGPATYHTVLGPQVTWRLVAHRRSVETRRRWVYREDIL